jgi:hypothetical protein
MFKAVLSFVVGLVLALGICSSVASATPATFVAQSPDKSVVITLTTLPCEGKVAALLKEGYAEKLKAATVNVRGESFEACWAQVDGMVGIILETGEQGAIPADAFQPAESA